MFRQLKKFYVSQTDAFLQRWRQQHPELSSSQKAEIKKHERIFRLRDQAEPGREQEELWKDF